MKNKNSKMKNKNEKMNSTFKSFVSTKKYRASLYYLGTISTAILYPFYAHIEHEKNSNLM